MGSNRSNGNLNQNQIRSRSRFRIRFRVVQIIRDTIATSNEQWTALFITWRTAESEIQEKKKILVTVMCSGLHGTLSGAHQNQKTRDIKTRYRLQA